MGFEWLARLSKKARVFRIECVDCSSNNYKGIKKFVKQVAYLQNCQTTKTNEKQISPRGEICAMTQIVAQQVTSLNR